MTDAETTKYLNRIQLNDCHPNLEGLTKLQEHHMEYIPFENLDIVVGREIRLTYQHLFEKIITKKRGGYCFELNTLYTALLKSLGFSSKAVLGRVWLSNPKHLPPRNHLAHIVELEGKTYVTDVGFGGLISSIPLDINVSTPVNDKDGLVRVSPLADHQYMIQRHNDKEWTNLYSFENVEVSAEDIEISNYYMSTHPNSHFYDHKFAGRSTPEGRVGLFNNKMSIRKGIKVVDKKRVEYGEDWIETIKREFSIELDFTDQEFNVLFEKELKRKLS